MENNKEKLEQTLENVQEQNKSYKRTFNLILFSVIGVLIFLFGAVAGFLWFSNDLENYTLTDQAKKDFEQAKALTQQYSQTLQEIRDKKASNSEPWPDQACWRAIDLNAFSVHLESQQLWAYRNLKNLLANKDYQALARKASPPESIFELCINSNESISLVLFGDYNESELESDWANNVIASYDTRNDTLDYQKVYSPGLGDIGVCDIEGILNDSSILFSCYGGDGPYGYMKSYLLSLRENKLITLKDCEYFYSDEQETNECRVNLLQ